MKAFSTKCVLAAAICTSLLAASTASAGGFSFSAGKSGGKKGGGISVNVGGGHKHHHHKVHHHGHKHNWWYHNYNHGKYYNRPYVKYYSRPVPVVISQPAPVTVITEAAPAANIRLAASEPARMQVPVGSALVIDGQPLGDSQGAVRLLISNMALPVEVLEWSAASAKIRLPELDLAAAMPADLEVLRADGSLASKTAIELVPATGRVALGN